MAPHSQPWITRIDPNCGPQGVVPGCSFGNPDRAEKWPSHAPDPITAKNERSEGKRPLAGIRTREGSGIHELSCSLAGRGR